MLTLKLHGDLDLDLVDPSVYRQLIGSLMYLVNTWASICFVVNTLSHFMVELRLTHWIAAKYVLQYLKGTIHYGLRYVGDGESMFYGFIGSHRAGDAGDMKGTLGCCFSLGSECFPNLARSKHQWH